MAYSVSTQLIQDAKMAKRIATTAYDSQVQSLLEAALLDLRVAGVEIPESMDCLVSQAAITYFLMRFGEPENYDKLKASYDEQKAQLSTCTGYTDWLVGQDEQT